MRSITSTVAAAALLAAALGAPARAQQMQQVIVAMPAIAGIFSAEYVAEDAGIYKKNGLDVKDELIQGIGAANAVISGSVQFSHSSGVTLTRAAARGQPLIALATPYTRTGFWVVISKKIAEERHFDRKAPLAERAKVMKGLRISVGAIQAIPHAYLDVIARAGGLDPDTDLTVSAIAPPDTVPSLQRDAIDGFSGGPPQLEEAVDPGLGVVLADGNDAPVDPPWLNRVAADVVLVRPQTCEQNRSLCAAMARSTEEATEFMHDHPKETMAIMGKRLNIADQKLLGEVYKATLAATPRKPLSDAKMLSTADDLNVQAGFMKASDKLSSYDKLYDNEYLK